LSHLPSSDFEEKFEGSGSALAADGLKSSDVVLFRSHDLFVFVFEPARPVKPIILQENAILCQSPF
jgi:hypothetical protein